jgi:hypothetical protein
MPEAAKLHIIYFAAPIPEITLPFELPHSCSDPSVQIHERRRKNRVSLSISWQIHAGRPRSKENAAEMPAKNKI